MVARRNERAGTASTRINGLERACRRLRKRIHSSFIRPAFGPWYLEVFLETILESTRSRANCNTLYPGRYVLELDRDCGPIPIDDSRREKPVLSGDPELAIETLGKNRPSEDFVSWSGEDSSTRERSWPFNRCCLTRLCRFAVNNMSSQALDWLLGRRPEVPAWKTFYGHRQRYGRALVQGGCAVLDDRGSNAVRARAFSATAPRFQSPFDMSQSSGRPSPTLVRATKKDLLAGCRCWSDLTPASRELVATGATSAGRPIRSVNQCEVEGEVGSVSPMDSSAMVKRAKDRDILRIFRRGIPDRVRLEPPNRLDARWKYSTFAGLCGVRSYADPTRAMRLIEQFEPAEQERAAGYALDALADVAKLTIRWCIDTSVSI